LRAGCWLLAGVFVLALWLAGCASKAPSVPPRPAEPSTSEGRKPKATQRPYTVMGKTYHPLPTADGYQEKGLASWYGPNFHGKRTSNGEVYDMEAMTAAHKTLPLDTWVEVRNVDNGKTIVVRVNDRGPFVDGRIIDLSKAAARESGVLGPGTARVEVVALGYRKLGTGVAGRPAVYEPPASYEAGTFTVQVGAFTNKANADRLAESLRPVWKDVFVVRYDRGDAVFHRVRVGKVEKLAQAMDLQQRLRTAGQGQSFAVAW
jgi:rare lipoprotein A